MTHTQTQGADGAGTKTGATVREALKELREAATDMLISLPSHWHDDATIRLTDAAADAETALSAAEQNDLYDVATPAPAATPGVPDSLRALSEDYARKLDARRAATSAYNAAYDAILKTGRSPKFDELLAERSVSSRAETELTDATIVLLDACRYFASHPTGQAGDAGASPVRAALEASMEARGANRQQAFFREAAARDRLSTLHAMVDRKLERYRANKPAPDSTCAGAANADDAEPLTSTDCVAHWEAEQKIAASDEALTSTDCVALWEAERKIAARTGAVETERPDGAIHNGREHLRRLGLYGVTANDGHVLDHCEDYIGAQQCFEVMADALAARPEAPSDAGWVLAPETGARTCTCPSEPHFDGTPCLECPGWDVAHSDVGPMLERVRHLKRGTEYEVLGEAETQISKGESNRFGEWRALYERDKLTVYRCTKTGKLWCRFPDEFRDGRFETITPPSDPAPSGQAEG